MTASAAEAVAESPEVGLLVASSEAAGQREGEGDSRILCVFSEAQRRADGSVPVCYPASLSPVSKGSAADPGRRYRVLLPGDASGGWIEPLRDPASPQPLPAPGSAADATATATQLVIEAGLDLVPESFGEVALTVRRSCPEAPCDEPAASVEFRTVSDTAIAGADFTAVAGTLSWAAGETGERTFSVEIVDDTCFEPDVESFSVVLENPTTGTELVEGQAKVLIEIVDDDAPATGRLQFAASALEAGEADGDVSVRVVRSGSTCPASVRYEAAAGTATPDEDFQPVSGRLEWAAGDDDEKSFSVTIVDDADPEPSETVTLTLSDPIDAELGSPASATLTILDNDTPGPGELRFAASALQTGEAAGAVTVRVLRTGGSTGPASVRYEAAAGSGSDGATAGEDFEPVAGTLSWADGDGREKTFSVPILDDDAPEPSQTVTLTLTDAVGAELGSPATATLTIIDDDSPLTNGPGELRFAKETLQRLESVGTVVVRVLRSGGSAGPASVRYEAVAGSGPDGATAGEDFKPVSDRLEWADGEDGEQTFSVEIVDDAEPERKKETVILRLSDPMTAELGSPAVATLIIVDNEALLEPSSLDPPETGTSLEGGLEDKLPLAVRVSDERGDPVPRAGVLWEVLAEDEEEPRGELLAGCEESAEGRPSLENRTGDDGVAGVCLRLSRVGAFEVRASLPSNPEISPVIFSIASRYFVTTSGEQPDADEAPVALVLEVVCADRGNNSAELNTVCDELQKLAIDKSRLRSAFDALSIDDHGAQAEAGNNAGAAQTSNLLARMAAIKGGAAGLGIEQLAFDIRGERIPGRALAGLLTPTEAGGDRIAASGRILPHAGPWEGWVPGPDGDRLSNRDLERLLAPRWDHGEAPFDLASLLGRAESTEGTGSGKAAEPSDDERFERKLRFFVNGTIALGDRPSSETETGFDLQTAGLSFGVDYSRSDSLVLGAALGYVASDVDLDGGSKVEIDGQSLGAFVLYFPTDHLTVDGLAIYGRNRFAMNRFVDFPGRPGRVRGEPDGDQISLGLGVGYGRYLGPWNLNGSGRLGYLEARIDAYEERGVTETTGYELKLGEQELTSLVGRIGLDVTYAISHTAPALIPRLGIAYLHEFEDDSRFLTASFVGDLRASPATFAIPTERPDRDYFSAGVGLQILFGCDRQLSVAYDRDLARADLDLYAVRAELRFSLEGCKKIVPPSSRSRQGG